MRRPPTPLSETHRDVLGRLASNVRALRVKAGWTQAEAAWECGLAVFTYQCVEGAETGLTSATLAALCDGFKVDVLALMQPAKKPPPRPRGRPRKEPSG